MEDNDKNDEVEAAPEASEAAEAAGEEPAAESAEEAEPAPAESAAPAAEAASPPPAAAVVAGPDKGPLKAKLRELQARRDQALASGDGVALKRVRAKIRRLKRKLRKSA